MDYSLSPMVAWLCCVEKESPLIVFALVLSYTVSLEVKSGLSPQHTTTQRRSLVIKKALVNLRGGGTCHAHQWMTYSQ